MEYRENISLLNGAKIIDSQDLYEELIKNHEYDLYLDKDTPCELFGYVFPGVYIDTDKIKFSKLWTIYEVRLVNKDLVVCRYGEFKDAVFTNTIFVGSWLCLHMRVPMYIPTSVNDIKNPTFVNRKTEEEKHEWPF